MNRLKELREKAGLSYEELAVKLGVSVRYIRFIETGDRTPSLRIALKISKLLNKDVNDIFLLS